MKHFIPAFVLLLGGTLFLSSCTKDGLTPREQKLIGTWEVHKVTYCKPLSINTQEETDLHRGAALTFFEDHSLTLVDPSGNTFTGNWELYRNRLATDDGSTSAEFLDLNLFDATTGSVARVLGRKVYLTNQKLRSVDGDFTKGQHNYRWRK